MLSIDEVQSKGFPSNNKKDAASIGARTSVYRQDVTLNYRARTLTKQNNKNQFLTQTRGAAELYRAQRNKFITK